MDRRCLSRLLLIAVALVVAFPALAEARRFKRYPGDERHLFERSEQAGDEDKVLTYRNYTPQPSTEPAAPAPFPPRNYELVAPSQPYGANYEDAGDSQVHQPPGETAESEEAEEPEDETDEPEGPPGLLGYTLHGRGGLQVEYVYTGDVFGNARGGINTRNAIEYLGLFNVALTADLGYYRLLPGGKFFMLAEDFHGRGITNDHVGDFQVVDNIDPGRQNFQVSEFWWERGVWNERIRVRLGKQDANAEFGVVDLGGDFVNSSFGMAPNIIMPAWPDQAMGVLTFFQITKWLNLNVGVFDGAADGRTWGFSGTGDILSIYELKAMWSLLDGRLPGDFHVGMWYHNGQFPDLAVVEGSAEGGPFGSIPFRYKTWSLALRGLVDSTDEKPLGSPLGAAGDVYAGNHGVYLGLEQMIFKESWDPEDDQGLGAFVHYGWAPEDRNEVPHYIGGGLVYKGILPGRNDDMLGAGVANVFFSDRLGLRSDHETAVELYYKIQLSPYIILQPDMQVITSPGGQQRDALVFGLRFEAVL